MRPGGQLRAWLILGVHVHIRYGVKVFVVGGVEALVGWLWWWEKNLERGLVRLHVVRC